MNKGFSTLVERFLVFVTASSYILALAAIGAPVLNNPDMDRILINWFSYMVFGVSGLIISLMQQIFAREKIKPYLHIVACFFYIVIVVIICGLAGQMNLPYIVIPFMVFLYIIETVLNDMFVFHDRFIDECGDYIGKELETHLFHNNLSAIDFGAKARAAEGLLTALPLILFLETFAVMKNGYTISIFSLIFILLFFAGMFFYFFILGIYKNDVFYGFLGFRDYIENKPRLLRAISIILGAACIFGIVFSTNHAILKITFGMMETTSEAPRQHQIQPMPEMQNINIASELDRMFPENERFPAWIWDLIFGIIKWAAIIGLTSALIIFFFKPFFSNHFRQFWKEGRLWKFLMFILDEIREFFKYVFSKSVPVQPYATVQSKKFGESIKDFIKKAGRSKEKREEIDRLTKHFMRLIDWGESKGIKYSSNLAPAEYTSLFKNETADLAGQLFEKALYDKNVLSKEEETLFISSINTILNSEVKSS